MCANLLGERGKNLIVEASQTLTKIMCECVCVTGLCTFFSKLSTCLA